MGKSVNIFISESFDSFGFLENGLFGDKISALFDADSDVGRIIAMIAAFVIAAAVHSADRSRGNRKRAGTGSCIRGGRGGNGRNIYRVKVQGKCWETGDGWGIIVS